MIGLVVEKANLADSKEGGRLAELYLRHGHEALRLAYLLTGDRSLAEDVTQEAFVRLAGRLAHIRDPNAFPAYLRRTVANLCKMSLRRRGVERRYLESHGPITAQAAHTDPDTALLESVRGALIQLPYRQRAAIVLRFYVDLPDTETADILGCSSTTVRSLISRGLERLRTRLGGS